GTESSRNSPHIEGPVAHPLASPRIESVRPNAHYVPFCRPPGSPERRARAALHKSNFLHCHPPMNRSPITHRQCQLWKLVCTGEHKSRMFIAETETFRAAPMYSEYDHHDIAFWETFIHPAIK